jgi:prophage regulatory protein
MSDATPSLRILRGHEVEHLTGIGESARNRMEAADQFPRRVKITAKAVGWIEGEILAWVKGRMALRDELEAQEANLPPGVRYRLRRERERETNEKCLPETAA